MSHSPEQLLLRRIYDNWLHELPKGYSIRDIASHNKSSNWSIGSFGGLRRETNQDQVAIVKINVASNYKNSFLLFAVLDGMGGMEEGAECARLALSAFISSLVFSQEYSIEAQVKAAAIAANRIVYEKYRGNGGTTFSAIISNRANESVALNIGDSRIYQFFVNKSVKQITTDDTIASLARRTTNAVESDSIYESSGLLQFMGIGNDFEPHILQLSNDENSGYVLVSDGAYKLSNGAFDKIILNAKSAHEIVTRLTTLSEWIGGYDNATAACIWPHKQEELIQEQSNTSSVVLYVPTGETFNIQGQLSHRSSDEVVYTHPETVHTPSSLFDRLNPAHVANVIAEQFPTQKSSTKKNSKKSAKTKTAKETTKKKKATSKKSGSYGELPLEIKLVDDNE